MKDNCAIIHLPKKESQKQADGWSVIQDQLFSNEPLTILEQEVVYESLVYLALKVATTNWSKLNFDLDPNQSLLSDFNRRFLNSNSDEIKNEFIQNSTMKIKEMLGIILDDKSKIVLSKLTKDEAAQRFSNQKTLLLQHLFASHPDTTTNSNQKFEGQISSNIADQLRALNNKFGDTQSLRTIDIKGIGLQVTGLFNFADSKQVDKIFKELDQPLYNFFYKMFKAEIPTLSKISKDAGLVKVSLRYNYGLTIDKEINKIMATEQRKLVEDEAKKTSEQQKIKLEIQSQINKVEHYPKSIKILSEIYTVLQTLKKPKPVILDNGTISKQNLIKHKTRNDFILEQVLNLERVNTLFNYWHLKTKLSSIKRKLGYIKNHQYIINSEIIMNYLEIGSILLKRQAPSNRSKNGDQTKDVFESKQSMIIFKSLLPYYFGIFASFNSTTFLNNKRLFDEIIIFYQRDYETKSIDLLLDINRIVNDYLDILSKEADKSNKVLTSLHSKLEELTAKKRISLVENKIKYITVKLNDFANEFTLLLNPGNQTYVLASIGILSKLKISPAIIYQAIKDKIS